MSRQDALQRILVGLRNFRSEPLSAEEHETADQAFARKILAVLEALKLIQID